MGRKCEIFETWRFSCRWQFKLWSSCCESLMSFVRCRRLWICRRQALPNIGNNLKYHVYHKLQYYNLNNLNWFHIAQIHVGTNPKGYVVNWGKRNWFHTSLSFIFRQDHWLYMNIMHSLPCWSIWTYNDHDDKHGLAADKG